MQNYQTTSINPPINELALLAQRQRIVQSMTSKPSQAPSAFPIRNYLTPTFGQEAQI